MTCRGNSLGEGLELLPVPLHHPLARKHKGWQAPYSAPETWQFISVSGPPVSTEPVQEGWQQLAWRGGAPAPSRVQLLPCPTPPARADRTPESEVTLGGGREELEASWSGLQGRDDTTTTTSSSSYQSGAEMLSQDKPVYTQFRSAKNITSGVTGSIYSRASGS